MQTTTVEVHFREFHDQPQFRFEGLTQRQVEIVEYEVYNLLEMTTGKVNLIFQQSPGKVQVDCSEVSKITMTYTAVNKKPGLFKLSKYFNIIYDF